MQDSKLNPETVFDELVKIFRFIEKGEFHFELPQNLTTLDSNFVDALKSMLEALRARQIQMEEDSASAREALQELQASYEQLTALQILSSSLNSTFEMEEVFHFFCSLASEVAEAKSFLLLLLENGTFKKRYANNPSPQLLSFVEKNAHSSFFHWLIRENKVAVFSPEELLGDDGESFFSLIFVPILSHEKRVGILVLESLLPPNRFTRHQSILLSLLSAQASAGWENAELYKGLQQKNIELAQLKNYLSNILENVTTGIFSLDMEGRIASFNKTAEKIFRLNSDEIIGKFFFEVFPDPLRSTLSQHLLSCSVMGEVSHYELDAEFAGTVVPLALNTSLLKDEAGNPMGFVVTCRDISETRELDAMRKLSQLKSEFLSSISHELRTPLTSIKAYAETLLNRLDQLPRPILVEGLHIIDSETDRMVKLVDDLLDFSRIDAGKLKLHREHVDLRFLIESVVSEMKFYSNKHALVFVSKLERAPALLDTNRIKQAVINLMNNGIKYSPDGGEVSCTLMEENETYHVVVEDHGIGIPSESLPHVFEKFYRVEGPYMYKIGGTGLGLSITKAIIEAHGGKIWLESLVGKGTVVHFVLPKEVV
jgi:two-component system OmpR family sensor kinase